MLLSQESKTYAESIADKLIANSRELLERQS